MAEKVKCAIVGSGNIGTDLLFKLRHDPYLEVALVVGVDPNSEGLALAKRWGAQTTSDGIEGFRSTQTWPTSSSRRRAPRIHAENAPVYKELGKIAIDLTPAAVGPIVVPSVNLDDAPGPTTSTSVTCGAQATSADHARDQPRHGGRVRRDRRDDRQQERRPRDAPEHRRVHRRPRRARSSRSAAPEGQGDHRAQPGRPANHDEEHRVRRRAEQRRPRGHPAHRREPSRTCRATCPATTSRRARRSTRTASRCSSRSRAPGAYLPKYAGNLDIETAAAVTRGAGVRQANAKREAGATA